MDEQQKQVVDVIKQATNILVTVKTDPSIDQLAACIALTLVLNELGKHGTAVFSGHVPSVLEFLEPEKTLERNTDSLQDFIISLDKSKADKLRYKVEDTVVKIFITPYRTSITDKDLEFGQGDFNVDAVIALGVHAQDDLDQAITAHGRILHDATVVSINTIGGVSEDLGSINWVDASASSLSEMVAGIANALGKEDVVDNQVATALLTGIVAETERFGNAKTSPHTMEVSAQLLMAGANQELVATKLSEGSIEAAVDDHSDDSQGNQGGGDGGYIEPMISSDPGMLEIEHGSGDDAGDSQDINLQSAADALQVGRTADEFNNAAPNDVASDSGLLDIPQPPNAQDETPHAAPLEPLDTSHDEPAAQSEATPASKPVEAPVPQGPSAEEQAKAEEDAALELIKERKVELDDRAVIQPLREQGAFLGEEPKVTQKDLKPLTDDERKAANALNDTKFALTPPSMGAPLNSLSGEEESDLYSPTASLAAAESNETPLLSHSTPGIEALASDAATGVATTPPVIPPTPQAVSPAVKPEYKPDIPGANDTLIAPAFDMAASSSAAPDVVPAPTTPEQSLADLEKRVNSPHIDSPSDSLIDPPVGDAMHDAANLQPLNMPQPSAITLPEPQQAPPTNAASGSATPPPPVPPPMMPPMPQTS